MTTATATTTPCPECGHPCKGNVGLGVHLSMKHGKKASAPKPPAAPAVPNGVLITFASGATRTLEIDPDRVVGLDPEGRVLVNDFVGGDDGFLFGLTLCCNASDKGTETGVACRGCYGTEETGQYYFNSHYPEGFDKVIADPKVETKVAVVQTDCPKCFRFHEGECPPPPTTVTLPHTGVVVPIEAAKLRIKITGTMKGHEGEAFTAEVWDGKRLRGTIENNGYGGGTEFYHHTAADMRWFDDLVDEYAAIDKDHRFVAHESLCNDLFEEVALFRDMNRKRNAVILNSENATTRLVGTEIIEPEIYMLNKPLDDGARAWVRANYPNARVWVKGKGWEQA